MPTPRPFKPSRAQQAYLEAWLDPPRGVGVSLRVARSWPAAKSEEQAESRGVYALLRDGSHLEVILGRSGGRLENQPNAVVTVIVAVATMTAVLGAQQRADSAPLTPPTVLFTCPHGAAKSVLASAYFERLAKERGLSVRVESAGTDPDPTVSPAVAAPLMRQGYPAPKARPRMVSSKDFESADVVISIGCDLSSLPEPRGKLVRWAEVPPLSEDFARADEAIRKRVTELIEELMRSAPKKK